MHMRLSQYIRKRADTVNVVVALNKLVADTIVLSQKIHGYHWIVLSENFFDLHDEFGKLYAMLDADLDEFAERVRQLGYFPVRRLQDMLERTSIQEDGSQPPYQVMAQNVLDDLSVFLQSVKVVIDEASSIGDRPTVFLMDSKVGPYEKHQWFLRSFIQKAG